MGLVLDLGRFGNALSRISKALSIAFDSGWHGLIVPRASHHYAYRALISRQPLVQPEMLVSFGGDNWGPNKPPKFLVRRDFHYESLSPSNESKTRVRAILPRIFSEQVVAEETPAQLTIHIRSGDIFFREGVSRWGQPPYAFYAKVLESRDWDQVVVVSQDDRSPVLSPLRQLCERLGLPVRFQSGNLAEDLTVLLGARNLIVGRGTFGPGVAILSQRLERLYFFEDRFNSPFLDPNLKYFRVLDREGGYKSQILGENWRNTESQQKLMVSYPIASLDMSPFDI
jgi:hypothetical protein